MRLNLILFATALLSITGICGQDDKVWQSLDDAVNLLMQAMDVPGMSVSVVQNGTVQKLQGYGLRNLEKKQNVSSDTIFSIGSMTKGFTAFLAVKIFSERQLSLDEPLVNILGNGSFYFSDRYRTEALSMRDLLSDRTCIQESKLVYLTGTEESRDETVRRMRYLPEVCPFRTRFVPNSHLYTFAGWVLEKITGTSWEQLVKVQILTPLNMTSSVILDEMVENFDTRNAATPYFHNDTTLQPVEIKLMSRFKASNPGGGLASSAADMTKWMQFLLECGQGAFNPMIVAQLFDPAIPLSVRGLYDPTLMEFYFGYGLGFGIGMTNNYTRFMHTGYWTKHSSQMSLFPDIQLGIFSVTNGPSMKESSMLNAIVHDLIFSLITQKKNLDVKSFANSTLDIEFMFKSVMMKSAPLLDTTVSFSPKNYIGQYGNASFGNVTVAKGPQSTLLLKSGYLEAQLMPTNLTDIFLVNMENSTVSSESMHQWMMANFTGSNGNDDTRRFIELSSPAESMLFERGLLLSDAPLKLWDDNSCR